MKIKFQVALALFNIHMNAGILVIFVLENNTNSSHRVTHTRVILHYQEAYVSVPVSPSEKEDKRKIFCPT